MTDGPRALIRLDALQDNFRLLKNRCPEHRFIAAVKANAYGHGLLAVARSLTNIDCLAVARFSEAEDLRRGDVRIPIMVLSGALKAVELDRAAALDCWPVMHSAEQVSLYEQSNQAFARVWLKVDTGMHRLGVSPNDAKSLVRRLRATGRVNALGLMTHMANADELGDPMTALQLERFAEVAREHVGDVSVCNSALLLADTPSPLDGAVWNHTGGTWERPGIGLYGISPYGDREAADLGLRTVMQLESHLLDVKPIPAGDAVGYGGKWRAKTDTMLGVVAIGYGDGYPRHVGAEACVLVNGRQVPVVGRVSMDLLTVDLGHGARDQAGDVVVLWGDGLPVETVARWANTIPYTLVTGVTARVKRKVLGAATGS